MKILLIDDESALLEAAVRQLEIRGHTVFPASGVEAGRDILEASADEIDLVMTDHRLEDGYGIDFVVKMKALYPNCEYVVVSGYLNALNIEKLENHGIRYFRKPLLYGALAEKLRREWIMRKPVKEPEREPARPVAPVRRSVFSRAERRAGAAGGSEAERIAHPCAPGLLGFFGKWRS